MLSKTITMLLGILFLYSCAVEKHKNISYLNENSIDKDTDYKDPTLNIFQPTKTSSIKQPVLIFVHGGNWNSGKKETYGFLGKNFARKGVITVIPGYTLSPEANFEEMTKQIAEAIKWVQNNIENYSGDPTQIYLTGHSAGGHLIALATLNQKYGIDQKEIAGIVLNDAAGLDMYTHLQKYPPSEKSDYLTTWTSQSEKWKEASPIYYLSDESPKFKIYLGSKTYPSIDESNKKFINELHQYQPNVKLDMINKRHIPMVLQYFWSFSNRYDEILKFIHDN